MNVPRRILYSAIIAAILTAIAIQLTPEINYTSYSVPIVSLGALSTFVLAAVSFYKEGDFTLHDKNLLMNAFLIAALVPTFYTAGAFVHQSQTSWSGGEIHYHADFEVFVQRNGKLERLDLINPSKFCDGSYMCSLNDRTGITKYHEHNDNRIHLEGIFETRSDATLAAFFETFNGELSNTRLVFPTNDDIVRVSETTNSSLKIVVNRGTGGSRHWCVVGRRVPDNSTCRNPYTGKLARSPSTYIVSPYKKGASLDDIFIIYDSRTAMEALKDLQEDGNYQGMGLKKQGEGF